ESASQEGSESVEESGATGTDNGVSVVSEKQDSGSDRAPEDATSPEETAVPGSVLQVAAANTQGEPVSGVEFTLWQEANDVVHLQQQGEADATEGEWSCRTSTEGTCAVGEVQGQPTLTPGAYYWVQTGTPEGYVTPAEQPVATAEITEAEAGTELEPAHVTVAESAPEGEAGEQQAGEQHGDGGAAAANEESSDEAPAAEGEGAQAPSEEPAGGESAGEEAGPAEDAEEKSEAETPEGEGAEGSAAADQPADESEGSASGP